MAKKIVNIDDLLADNQLELTIEGKVYVINDFNLDDFLRLMKDPKAENDPEYQRKIVQDQLAKAFRIESSELDHIGLRTLFMVVKTIRDWVIGDVEDSVGADRKSVV